MWRQWHCSSVCNMQTVLLYVLYICFALVFYLLLSSLCACIFFVALRNFFYCFVCVSVCVRLFRNFPYTINSTFSPVLLCTALGEREREYTLDTIKYSFIFMSNVCKCVYNVNAFRFILSYYCRIVSFFFLVLSLFCSISAGAYSVCSLYAVLILLEEQVRLSVCIWPVVKLYMCVCRHTLLCASAMYMQQYQMGFYTLFSPLLSFCLFNLFLCLSRYFTL